MTKEQENEILQALKELEEVRQEDYPVHFLEACIEEFTRLKWSTEKCVRKINECKYRDYMTRTRFSDFVKDETIINYWLIERQVDRLLAEKKVMTLANHYSEVKDLEQKWQEKKLIGGITSPSPAEKADTSTQAKKVAEEVRVIYEKALLTTLYSLSEDKERALGVFEKILETSKSEINYYINKLTG